MPINFYMYFVAAIIPLLIGFIYYHPKVAGTGWMSVNGFTDNSIKEGNKAMIFGLSYFYSILIAFTIGGIAIHQTAVFQMMMPDVMESGSAVQTHFNELMAQYGGNFRSFGHGALHGVTFSIFLVLPIIGINALFERRGWKYIMIHTVYWMITLALMGGLLCQTLEFA